jgi:hypothetical protein
MNGIVGFWRSIKLNDTIKLLKKMLAIRSPGSRKMDNGKATCGTAINKRD